MGAVPLATAASCERAANGFTAYIDSSNDNLIGNVLDLVFGEDDD
jgi:hypothetical protein